MMNHGGAIEDQGLYLGYWLFIPCNCGVVDGMDNFMTPGSIMKMVQVQTAVVVLALVC